MRELDGKSASDQIGAKPNLTPVNTITTKLTRPLYSGFLRYVSKTSPLLEEPCIRESHLRC